jgi:thiol-disulfide isomerase/thioredoxin
MLLSLYYWQRYVVLTVRIALATTTVITALVATSSSRAADLKEYTGDPMPPPLELNAWRGGQHNLEDYHGKVVLVNFWAGWCFPCIQEIPDLLGLADRMAGRPFVILAVDVGEKKTLDIVSKMDKKMIVLLDPESEVFSLWPGHGFPSTYLIDHTGKIRYEAYGPVPWTRGDVLTTIESLIMEIDTEPMAIRARQ